jgi:hypothetical protein
MEGGTMALERALRWSWILVAWMVLALAALCNPAEGAAATCGDGVEDLRLVDDVVYSARLECPCASFDSRVAFRSCVRDVVKTLVGWGALPKRCRAAAMRYARSSATCGAKQGKVTCCKGDACSLASSEARCEASRGGTGKVGRTESCFDACTPPPTPTPYTPPPITPTPFRWPPPPQPTAGGLCCACGCAPPYYLDCPGSSHQCSMPAPAGADSNDDCEALDIPGRLGCEFLVACNTELFPACR